MASAACCCASWLSCERRVLAPRVCPSLHATPQEPEARLATIAAAGRAGVPFTSGLLIGIGETRLERLQALVLLRELQLQHGHLQVGAAWRLAAPSPAA